MSKPVANLLAEAQQTASVKIRYGIVGDTLSQIADANDRGERGAPRRMRRSESEVASGWRKIGARYRIIAQTKCRWTTRSTSRRSSR